MQTGLGKILIAYENSRRYRCIFGRVAGLEPATVWCSSQLSYTRLFVALSPTERRFGTAMQKRINLANISHLFTLQSVARLSFPNSVIAILPATWFHSTLRRSTVYNEALNLW